MKKPGLRFSNLLITLLLLTGCFEFDFTKDESVPRTIRGVLVESCADPSPLRNVELKLVYRESLFVTTEATTTDDSGRFVFSFMAEDWHEGGIHGTYYAEINEAKTQRFIIDGVKPGHNDLDTIYFDFERIVDVLYQVDLTPLWPEDSLTVKGERSFDYYKPFNGTIGDTAKCYVGGSEHGQIQSVFDYNVRLQWRIYNSDTLRLWGSHVAKLDHACQKKINTKILIE